VIGRVTAALTDKGSMHHRDGPGGLAGDPAARIHADTIAAPWTSLVPLAPPPAAAATPEPCGHLALTAENGRLAPWCGPTVLALAAGRSYAEATTMLRAAAPDWYPAEGPIVTA
jgi:hypothetical protein